MAILLEKGTEDDHYDFLELYIQRWRQEHEKILLKCNEQRRERMSDQQKDDARHLFHQVPIQELNFTYFSREFHPYDW